MLLRSRIAVWIRRGLILVVFLAGAIGTAQVFLPFTLIGVIDDPVALSAIWIATVFLGIIEWMGLSGTVSRLENARPSIVFVQSSFTHLRQQEAQIFSLLQVWFLNAPKVRTAVRAAGP